RNVDDEYELQRMLVDTLDQVERNYVQGISRRELVEAAIDGILRKLDPYSSYIAPDDLDRFRGSLESEFGGIGIQITMDRGGRLVVLSPLVGTPAHRAGILSGDQIVEIDGRATKGIDLDEATTRLKGKTGSTVVLTVLHPGRTKPEKISVTREQIHVETVLGDHRDSSDAWDFMIDPAKGIGYVRVTAFSRGTADELRRVIKSLQARNLTGLILDLRFNAGGLLGSAIEVSDLFIEKGRIVSTSGRNVSERAWDAHAENTFTGFPMVVLVNRFSASASEIVAACLQDHRRAVVMGERTWGKGSVQNVIPLEHGHSALKLTTASYHRPSGKNIHRFPGAADADDWGVKPDEGYEVRLSTADLALLLISLRERDVLQPHGTASGKPDDASSGDPTAGKVDPAASAPRAADLSQKPLQINDRALRMAVEYLNSELVKAN
ncbi:MAG: S41 family peptidase, partial [Pirellulales bacterium]|nr:S41 family peptidase [Pirellulales bacterium]